MKFENEQLKIAQSEVDKMKSNRITDMEQHRQFFNQTWDQQIRLKKIDT